MGPQKKTGGSTRKISQEAFEELVRENIEELGMDPTEALQDAIQTLSLQGVDLCGLIHPTNNKDNNAVLGILENLNQLWGDHGVQTPDLERLSILFEHLLGSLIGIGGGGSEGSATINNNNAATAIAVRNGAVELVCSFCDAHEIFTTGSDSLLVLVLKTLSLLLYDIESTEKFRSTGGPAIIVSILNDRSESLNILNVGFAVIAAAATGNEVLKQSFMELKLDELILQVLNKHSNSSGIQGLYDAIRVLLTADDNRVVASQVYGYARRFAKIGIAQALVEPLRGALASPSLVSACIALKAVAVNDEICKSIAEIGGIDAILKCIDDGGEQDNKTVARTCCSLLSKLAGSDANKSAIVEKGGLDKLIQLSARCSDDPSVLQEVMPIITILCLRCPDNAARAMEAGAGDLAIQAMERFPASQQLQRNSCLMIRNLVVRNPENRALLLSNGIEKLIRKAKESHESCKDAAPDALRDLGLSNYNS